MLQLIFSKGLPVFVVYGSIVLSPPPWIPEVQVSKRPPEDVYPPLLFLLSWPNLL